MTLKSDPVFTFIKDTTMRYLSREQQRAIARLLKRSIDFLNSDDQKKIIAKMSLAIEENNGTPAVAFDKAAQS